MRTRTGWALSAFGVLVSVLGVAVMVVLGPDSRFSTGPQAIETDDIAVVTAPKLITWADVQIDLLAEVPVRKPIFVGIGNTVDVQDYVGEAQRLEVTSFERPSTITTREIEGNPNLPGAPTAVDWWIESSAGLGGATISTTLPDQTVSIAILSVGSSNLSGLEVTIAYGIKGGFAKGAALFLLGAGLVVTGVIVRRALPRGDDEWEGGDPDEDGIEEEVVYIYVDDDGVEHEISAEEAADLEVVEEVVEEQEPEPEPAQVEPEPEPVDVAPTVPQPTVPGVLTAADIAAGLDAPDASAAPDVLDDENVLYVYIDEDGVEHEVTADELAEFEIVDEEDQT